MAPRGMNGQSILILVAVLLLIVLVKRESMVGMTGVPGVPGASTPSDPPLTRFVIFRVKENPEQQGTGFISVFSFTHKEEAMRVVRLPRVEPLAFLAACNYLAHRKAMTKPLYARWMSMRASLEKQGLTWTRQVSVTPPPQASKPPNKNIYPTVQTA